MKTAPLSNAIRMAIGASVFAGVAMPAFAQDAADEQNVQVEEVYVTGSRIQRSTNTESQEIISITAEDMKLSGDISVADALRSSTLNSIGSFRESSGSSAQSNATINLRGAGASRSLVLVNGRRVVGSPSLGGGGTVNLNMIPFSAVDRIEIIADGASAVYGSDAIVGVVNVILKKGYDGMQFNARYGDRSRDDGVEKSFSFLTGAEGDRGSVTFGLEYDSRDPIFDADRDFTKARYSDLDGDGFITGYAETAGVSFYGYTLLNPNYDSSLAFDPNNQDSWYVTPGNNCVDDGSFVGPMKSDLVFGPDTGFYCGYAYANVSANRASAERVNAWVSSTFELNDSVELFADMIIAQNESFGRYAPPAAPGAALASDPRNPYGQAVNGYFRWVDIGTRDNVVNDTMTDVNIGIRGDINDSLSYESYYTYSDYRSASIGTYYLSYGGFEYNINYNITDYDQYVANLKSTTLNDDRMNLQKVFYGMQWDMFEMDGGMASSYFAAEGFNVKYAALVDGQSEAGLVGGSAGNSAAGSRSVVAFSAETVLPVTDWVTVDAAVRYDDYNDFGSAVSPRLGATFNFFDDLTIKASMGQGFRAPDLSDLYGVTSFSAEGATDNYGCQLTGQSPCPSRQFDTYIGSNPNLDAESSQTFSLGASYNFFDTWNVGVNYFTLDIEDAIDYVSAQDMLDSDFYSGGNESNVVRGPNGNVVEIYAGYQNASLEVNREAVDFSLNGMIETGFGMFDVAANSTMYINYDAEDGFGTGDIYNAAGTLGFPEWRSNLFLRWTMGDFSASWNTDYIGESESRASGEKFDAWMLHNATVSYDLAEFGAITLGANNILDEDPLLNSFGEQVDEYQYDNTGRVIYVGYSIEL